MGHSEATCCTKVRKKVGFSDDKGNDEKGGEKVNLVDETRVQGEAVNATKRLDDGQAIQNQAHQGNYTGIPVPRLFKNPHATPNAPGGGSRAVLSHRKKGGVASRSKRATIRQLQDYVSRYDALAELSNASCGLKLGQLPRGEAEEAKKVMESHQMRGPSLLHKWSISKYTGIPTGSFGVLKYECMARKHGHCWTLVLYRISCRKSLQKVFAFLPKKTNRTITVAS